MSGARRLIVNADDFGFTRDVNAGIIEAHRNGIVTATTIMATGNAFDDALRLARETPSIDIGVHIVLVQGQSALDSSRPLPPTTKDLVQALIRHELPVYEEIAAQIRRVMCKGVRPTHIDTHKHTHLLPPVLDALARAARDFGISWVRRPFDFGVDRPARILRSAVAVGLHALRPSFTARLKGLRTTDYFTGFQSTGFMQAGSLARVLARLPVGLTELMCHPGRLGPELRVAPTRLKQTRERELAALTAQEIRDLISRLGIQMTNYREAALFSASDQE